MLLLPVLARAMDKLDQEQGLAQGLGLGLGQGLGQRTGPGQEHSLEINYDTSFSYQDNNKGGGNQDPNPATSSSSTATANTSATIKEDPYTVTNFLWARLRSVLGMLVNPNLCLTK